MFPGLLLLRGAATTDIALIIIEFITHLKFLPLGGTHFSQIGLLLLTAYIIVEMKHTRRQK